MLRSTPHLRVSTPAAATRLYPLSLVKTYLGVTGSSDDTRLSTLTSVAGALFRGHHGLRRDYARQTYVEELPGRGGEYLLLSRWPIESVTSITEGVTAQTAVAASEYDIVGDTDRRDRLYNCDGWYESYFKPPARFPSSDDVGVLDYVVTYTAGWVMPGTSTERGAGYVTTWAAGTTYVAGEFVRSSTPSNNDLLLECTTAGTSDATEPTWPSAAAATVADNTVTWTAREARELPHELQEAALLQIDSLWRRDPQIARGSQETGNDPTVLMFPPVEAILESWR